MFRQEKRLGELAEQIRQAESHIDLDDKLYLMTWSPDPKELPDCDFINQHIFLVPYVQSYLQTCKCGAACVESTQEGNPHYHFWYQTSEDDREMGRIRWMKVMKRIGNVKINKARYYKIDRWFKAKNALYYYKYDAAGQQLFTPYNPVTATSPTPNIDYTDYNWFFTKGKQTATKIISKVSQIKDLENFYKKSL